MQLAHVRRQGIYSMHWTTRLLILLATSTALLIGTTSATAQEVIKVEEGTLFEPPEDGVFVTSPEFISIVARLDSLDFLRSKIDKAYGIIEADSVYIETIQRNHAREIESLEGILEIYKERPKPSAWEYLGYAGIVFTIGYFLGTRD